MGLVVGAGKGAAVGCTEGRVGAAVGGKYVTMGALAWVYGAKKPWLSSSILQNLGTSEGTVRGGW